MFIFNDNGISYFKVMWEKRVGVRSWEFNHKLKTSKNYLLLFIISTHSRNFECLGEYENALSILTTHMFLNR